tara:strand:+ start:1398 stop:1694 length:297 start_codon:yes stop_codon:yes gene_type:complete
MKLQDLATKPKLQEIILDDKELVKKYGDTLQFFVQDRLPIETYTKLASVKQDDPSAMYNVIKDLILNEEGLPVMSDGHVLPMDVMNAAIEKVTEQLGK